ncbi:MAG: DUF5678 domain-containing protein [Anaerolineae bacterium]|nr:DUF5678 domain-containing protein [Anaerolineae bacterium]MCI0695998.1 DUF5678 domain-containing protein [candidate division KSB1 bacterium]
MQLREEVHQRFEGEKQAYWAMRTELLKQYHGKWVAVVDGQIVAVGDKRGKVMEEAYRKTKSKVMFVSEVGHEDRVLRIRQVSTGQFDRTYHPSAPMIATPISDLVNTLSIDVDFIVDTGADLTVLRNDVAIILNLFDAPAGFSHVGGVGSKPVERQLYGALVHLAGQTITVAVDCRDDFDENLLGRDITNEFELTLCAKRELVRFEWVPDKPV